MDKIERRICAQFLFVWEYIYILAQRSKYKKEAKKKEVVQSTRADKKKPVDSIGR